ncbi:Neutral/alkaline nonlysosomal ceramidase [Xylona heveae TC161]|uniref:Neutral ceramidase n=1 Tax=Xylona heveae (strain CBS 132557 / TC161) TaxID=1328760 RepID=A0A164ZWG3_XYLHT|nr:Neutral/alkaline nonlysosomal ceramidase [Xylona heveae TC161]KZF19619.1 Neutral/alkaline nonlysosomal ceramidase [Xylona heveae TC161]
MSRLTITIALSSAFFALAIVLHIIYTYGLFEIYALSSKFPKGNLHELQSELKQLHDDSLITPKNEATHLLGVGKADITGPVVEINMMGYADPKQVGTGLRQRLYSRAFIVGEMNNTSNRFVYLVLDTQSGDTAVRYGILEGLANLGPQYAMYGHNNVAVTGTHSHSGPGAWLNYLLPQITSKGFDKQSYQAIVDGALLSIRKAHERLTLGHLSVGSIDILDANINRSPYAYLSNPKDERNRYKHDVDKALTLLKFQRASDDKTMGVLTWFPVHGTAMLGNNTLISGDNKGVAAYLFEKDMHNSSDASEEFVAGFSQANVGDTSPNVNGAFCEDGSGLPCDFQDSTCGGKNGACHGRGPFFGENDGGTKSCFEIGKRQFLGAKKLYDDPHAFTAIHTGTVRSLHSFANFSSFSFSHPNGSIVSTCPAALGYSFAAGTTDGPGAFDFKQNNSDAPNANPLWAVVRNSIHEPSEAQVQCHDRKPILLDVGETTEPYLWTPNVVDIQLFRVGQLIIIVSPGEASTMAGRRWREALAHESAALRLTDNDGITDAQSSSEELDSSASNMLVVLGGPANSYAHYITTEEEYGVQRYEGASTLYGPHTLNAYINLTLSYLPYLDASATGHPGQGPSPPNHVNKSLSFIPGVVYDRAPLFKSFGQVLNDVDSKVYRAGDSVSASFVGANPRNNLRLENTYVAVERKIPTAAGTQESDASGETKTGSTVQPGPHSGGAGDPNDEIRKPRRNRYIDHNWVTVRDDADWSLVFEWQRKNTVLGTSEAVATWEIEDDTPAGTYRLHYYGDAKSPVSGTITPFDGVSGEFHVQ